MIPKYIIWHAMGELIEDGPNIYTAKEWLDFLNLSAHGGIEPNGNYQHWNDFNKICFHVGISKWKDDENLNNCSIGFEALVKARNYPELINAIKLPSTFTQGHYDTLSKQSAIVCKEFELYPDETCLTHKMVSGDHVRGKGKGKQDIGSGFDYMRCLMMTKAELLKL